MSKKNTYPIDRFVLHSGIIVEGIQYSSGISAEIGDHSKLPPAGAYYDVYTRQHRRYIRRGKQYDYTGIVSARIYQKTIRTRLTIADEPLHRYLTNPDNRL